MQWGVWALVLWPFLPSLSFPLDCREELASLSRCASIAQEKLLDRVIRHAELIYHVSEESCSLFEAMFVPFPLQLQRHQVGYECFSRTLPIPSSKSDIQQISDKWLLHSVLMLVNSWIKPLVFLHTTLENYDEAPEILLNKTKWVSDKLISLEQGMVTLIKKMLNEVTDISAFSDQGLFLLNPQPDMLESVLRDYTLFSCFKKDAHKMEVLLKLLKCRQNDTYICA